MATICTVVFHLASRDTGSPTWASARNSRRPETRISRHRMISAGRIGARSKWTSIRIAAPTSSLSAIGSSMRPNGDCIDQLRAR